MRSFIFLLFLYSLSPFLKKAAADTLTPLQSLRDNRTIISAGGSFELGFFSPNSSQNRYLGIWYKNISTKTVVWVANRNNPLNDSSGVLKIDDNEYLSLLDQTSSVIWSSSSSSNNSKNGNQVIAQLLDTGNLVLRYEINNDPEGYIWQSFDYPSNSLIEGMKLGWDLEIGLNRNLTSWKSADDPSTGDYTSSINTRGLPQLVVYKGSTVYFRAGPWNGLRFSGGPELKPNVVFIPNYVETTKEVYYSFGRNGDSVISRLVLNPSGILQRLTWNDRSIEWIEMQRVQKDRCDDYNLCGPYGKCNINDSPLCTCLKGFTPKSPEDWNQINWSGGCTRRTNLSCQNGDGFLKFPNIKLPDTSKSWVNKSINLEECKAKCLWNCSCVAYSNSNITGIGSGCVMWFGELLDIRQYSSNGQDLYLRMAASEQEKMNESGKKKKQIALVVSISVILGMLLLGLSTWYFIRKAGIHKIGKMRYHWHEDNDDEPKLDFPTFSYLSIEMATNNFSLNNKLGEGGFGSVYKGKLSNGKEIAVKRLSKTSGQGFNEFKNEIILIAKLQHRNLVRLQGCCIQRQETMLIYEYMPNKSLDSFIFDQSRSTSINWQKRFNIIVGIAQGLLYLHRDSRLRIIHRDLKASNVLLDSEMNPKISDFGLAKTFRGDQTEANTQRVVGTYGYMSPEYAIDGLFSAKSDVFSFGVLLLEIVSGKRNRGFEHPDHDLNLLGHAWMLWNETNAMKLIEPVYDDQLPVSEVLKCIHVGLLCVQQRPEDRPNMPYVVLMLSSETAIMPQPKQPGFYSERNLEESDLSISSGKQFISTEMSTTSLEAR